MEGLGVKFATTPALTSAQKAWISAAPATAIASWTEEQFLARTCIRLGIEYPHLELSGQASDDLEFVFADLEGDQELLLTNGSVSRPSHSNGVDISISRNTFECHDLLALGVENGWKEVGESAARNDGPGNFCEDFERSHLAPNVRHERRPKGREAAFGTSARWRG